MRRRLIGTALGIGLALGPTAAPAAAQPRAQVRFDLSPAGQAVVKRYLGTPAPEAKALATRMAALAQRQRALATAPKLDLVQFAAVLRQQEQLQGQMLRFANDRMLRMLRELSEADRAAFLRGLANPVRVPAPAAK